MGNVSHLVTRTAALASTADTTEGLPSKDRQFVTALARGLDILRAFHAGEGMLGNQEIAHRTGLPKPTVARLTHTLTDLVRHGARPRARHPARLPCWRRHAGQPGDRPSHGLAQAYRRAADPHADRTSSSRRSPAGSTSCAPSMLAKACWATRRSPIARACPSLPSRG